MTPQPTAEGSLSGRTSGRSFLATILVAASVLGLLAFQLVETELSSRRTVGFLSAVSPEGVLVDTVYPDSPADRAGLMAGDLITAVGGQPISSVAEYDGLASRFLRGDPVVFAVLRRGTGMTMEVRPGVPYPWMDVVPFSVAAICYLVIGLLSLFQGLGDIRARLCFLFTLAVAIELALPVYAVGDPGLAAFITGLYLLLTGVQVGLELHLASVIPQPQRWLQRHRWVVPGYYLLGATLSLAVFLPFVGEVTGRSLAPWGSEGAMYVLFGVGMPVWAIGVAWLLGRQALFHPEARGRHQAGLVLAGVSPWALSVLATSAVAMVGGTAPEWLGQLEPFILICYPVAIFAAIFRYQLFDIELVVKRTLVYTALTTTMVVTFYLLLGAGGALFSRFVASEGSVWVIASTTLVLGLLFAPLRRGIERQVYRRFFPERFALRHRLTELAGKLPTLGKLPAMSHHLVESLREVFGVRGATLLLTDPHSNLLVTVASSLAGKQEELEHSLLLSPDDPGLKLLARSGRPFPARQLRRKSGALTTRLDRMQARVVVPLLSEGRLVGLLVMGPKGGGEEYQAEELELLNLFAHHVVTVLENARLFESATRDSLTGLLRREMILETLQKELQRAVRYKRPLAIGMADLDHFKQVNDTYGHLVGDSLLKWVAHTMSSGLRASDFVGRYGGEEFLIVLPETDLEGAVNVAEKVRLLVESCSVTGDDGQEIEATISIGLAGMEGTEEYSAQELIAAADRSLYQAKKAGRNQVQPGLPRAG